MPTNLLSIDDLSLADVEHIFAMAHTIARDGVDAVRSFKEGLIFSSLFFQSSTRTRLGFEAAAHKLGLRILSVPDIASTRSEACHQESIEDAVRVLQEISDVIVVRSFQTKWFEAIEGQLRVPVINAGDGINEHPSQALADLWVMSQLRGDLSALHIGLAGDMTARVHRSFIKLLCICRPLKINLYCGANLPDAQMQQALSDARIPHEYYSDIQPFLEQSHAIEMLPMGMPDLSVNSARKIDTGMAMITSDMVRMLATPPLILHPGPRLSELPDSLIEQGIAPYFEQVRMGLHVKTALLAYLLNRAYPVL